MKILLTGKNGQVGWELQRTLAPLGDIIALDSIEFDLANADFISKTIRDIKPNIIVNPAAYTAVDQAEKEPELATAINSVAPGILADEAKKLGAKLIHYSTDYVFDGTKIDPYSEEDTTNPLNIYGKSKLSGEKAIQEAGCDYLIFRTSWVYSLRRKNFLMTMLQLLKNRDEVRVVNDQFGAPNSASDLAEKTAHILSRKDAATGLYHLTTSDYMSWYDYACIIKSQIKSTCNIIPIPSHEYLQPAIRPKNSRLDSQKITRDFAIDSTNGIKDLTQHLIIAASQNV
jgi:dTDP-4-dehydrorhamnose reductase